MAFKAIIGLGNPDEYDSTYHNAGKLCVYYLSHDAPCVAKKQLFSAHKKDGIFYITLNSFMNDSGDKVQAALSYFKIDPEDIVLVHDDSDIPLGTFKFEKGRGTAGHHGVESVAHILSTKDFARIRIGIRPLEDFQEGTPARRKKAGDFVLSKISSRDKIALQSVFVEVGKEILALKEKFNP